MSTHPVKERGFRALLDAAPDAMVVVDPRGTVVAMSRQAGRLFGWTEAELLDEPLSRLIPARFQQASDSQPASDGRSSAIPAQDAPVNVFGRRRDGSEFPVEFSRSPLGLSDDALILVTIRDLTKSRRAQEILFREKEQGFVTLASI